MITNKSDKKRVEKKTNKKEEPKKEEVVEKETSISKKRAPDLKSLFGNVKTDVTKKPKKEVNNVSKSSNPKRYKSKFEKQNKSSNVKIDSLLEDEITTTNITSKSFSKNSESDEYFSLVNDKLSNWNPSLSSDNLEAVVIVTIASNGEFDYKFATYSQNLKFDESLKAFLEEQKSIIYPKPKNGKEVKISVKFKSKG
ncbi:MAG: TonB C-terminal domain-containing protein [Campylobacterota bacterium]